MPAGVDTFVDEHGDAHVSFPDTSLRAAAITRLLQTGAPIIVDTSGKRRSYVVPEGNAREAGLLDESDVDSTEANAGTPEQAELPTLAWTRKAIDDYAAEQDPPVDTVAATNKKAALALLGIEV